MVDVKVSQSYCGGVGGEGDDDRRRYDSGGRHETQSEQHRVRQSVLRYERYCT